MLNASFRLGKLAGVEIGLNSSVLLLAALITFLMGGEDGIFQNNAPGYSQPMYFLVSAVTAVIFIFSILVHEMAHALTARIFNIPVNKIVLSLIGGIAIFEEEVRKPVQGFWVAFMGPLSTAIFAGVCLALSTLLAEDNLIGVMLNWLGLINLLLAGFNMLPGFPLDGGHVLRAIVWFGTRNYLRATVIAGRSGQAISVFFGFVFLFQLIALGQVFNALWTLFIAWFLWGGARGQIAIARQENEFKDVTIGNAVNRRVQLKKDWPLVYAFDVMSMNGAVRTAPVVENEQIIGILTFESVIRLPRLQWGSTRVEQRMTRIGQLPSMHADTNIIDAIRLMELRNTDYVLVTTEDATVGVAGRKDLIHFAERTRRMQQRPT